MRFDLPSPRRSQPLLTRIAVSIAALVCLGILVAIGTFALAILVVLAIAWLIWFRWRVHKLRKQAAGQADQPHASRDGPDVIEGEYVVIHERHDNVH